MTAVASFDNAAELSVDAYTAGELALHADLACVELCVELAALGLGDTETAGALKRLRLAYWQGWVAELDLWVSPQEKLAFAAAAQAVRAQAPALPDQAVAQARHLGALDAATQRADL